MNRNRLSKCWWTFLGMIVYQSVAGAGESIMIENAWIRDAPPHAEMSAAYFTIMNHSTQAHTLIAVSSPQFEKAEIHRTQMVGDQVHMQREDTVTVAARGELEFSPGGYHLMLIHPLHTLKVGDMVELRLQFKDSGQIKVQAQIRESADEPHSHDMHDMNM